MAGERDGEKKPFPAEQPESEILSRALTHVLEECRMVLPGIQALFGFQLVAVFSSGFHEELDLAGELLHLGAIALVVLSIALVMTPAAYHRQCEPGSGVSEEFIRLASRCLLASMVPLGLATSIELFLIATIIVSSVALPAVLAAASMTVFATLWFVFPFLRRKKEPGTKRSQSASEMAHTTPFIQSS